MHFNHIPASAPTPISIEMASRPTTPAILREPFAAQPRWGAWREETHHGREAKVPCSATSQARAKSNQVKDWTSLATVYEVLKPEITSKSGLSYLFVEGDGHTGIDLDVCLDSHGRLTTWAEEIVQRFRSYTEISPSGTGVKIFCLGTYRGRLHKVSMGPKLPGMKKEPAIEVYSAGRYFTVTGNEFGGPREVVDCQAAIDWLAEKYFPAKLTDFADLTVANTAQTQIPSRLSDDEVIERLRNARNKYKYLKLEKKDDSDYGGNTSNADFAFVLMIAFYTRDPEQIARIWRRFRWRPKLRRADYVSGTIKKALARRTGACAVDQVDPTNFVNREHRRGIILPSALHTSTQPVSAKSSLPSANGDSPAPGQQTRPQEEGGDPVSGRFWGVDSSDFFSRTYSHEWLVRSVLVRGQPCVIGGSSKTLKTSIACDLAISLGTGSQFLAKFAVERPMKVMFLSGESGEATIQSTARRVGFAKNLDVTKADVRWGFDLPILSRGTDLKELEVALSRNAIEVFILDPLYLAMMHSGSGLNASNLYDMGPLLKSVSDTCRNAGATPILIHHFKRGIKPGTRPTLEDLSFSGITEFARQWILIGRREAYQAGSGLHKLSMETGGSAGHSEAWSIDIDEGRVVEGFGDRKWHVTVTPPIDAKVARDSTASSEKLIKERAEENELLRKLDELDPSREGFGRRALMHSLS